MTTDQIISRRAFPITVVLLLLTWGAFILFHVEQGRTDKNRKAERDSWIISDAHLKSELKLRDSLISIIQNDRAKDSAIHASKQRSLSGQIRGLKRQLLENPESLVIRDTIILKQDSVISDLETERDSIKVSFREEIRILKQKEFKLDSAATARLDFMISQSVLLDEKDQKISRLQRLARTLGISTGVLAVLSILLIAL
jgi:hypothetical protein